MAGALVVVTLTALGGWNQMVRAEVGGSGGGFTDYGNYPPALPEGCPDGPGALEGVSFTSGDGVSAGDLGNLALVGGDTVTMRWDRTVPACAGPDGQPAVDITLASHRSESTAGFDPNEDQLLLEWATCGPTSPCPLGGDGRYQLSLTLPTEAVACNAQVDAVLGPPLGMVGPSGSYYSGLLRPGGGPTMLVSAGLASTVPCQEGATTTSTAPEASTTTTTAALGSTTDATPPDTGTTTPESTSPPTRETATGSITESAPAGSALATDQAGAPVSAATAAVPNPAPATTTGPAATVGVTTPAVQPTTSVLGVTARQNLPATGARTDDLVVTAAMLIVLGAVARAFGARAGQRRAVAAPFEA